MSDRLLVIDDDAAVGAFVAKVARLSGFGVRTVTTADAFREALCDWRPTCIVVDLHMPDVDGIELLRFLAGRRCTARVVLLSGVDQKIIETARQFGVRSGLDIAAMVQKPVRAADLRRILEAANGSAAAAVSATRAAAIDAAALERAIAGREFHLLYQPKLVLSPDRADGTGVAIDGFEALLRWQHPQRGVVAPADFLPLAESLPMMDDLTALVVDLALEQFQAWRDAGVSTTLALNVSGANLHAVSFADRLAARVRAAGVPPASIVIELTETAAMADPTNAMAILTRLRLMGFRLSIDDFGTGYSSLVQLQRLPFSELKIDRDLVADCVSSPQSRVIVKAAIDLAHNLGMTACAEGIESAAVLEVVRDLGCDLAQGYHIGRPMAAGQTVPWLLRSAPSGEAAPEDA